MRSTYTNIIILTGLLTLAAIAAAERKPLAAAKEEHMEPKVDRYAGKYMQAEILEPPPHVARALQLVGYKLLQSKRNKYSYG